MLTLESVFVTDAFPKHTYVSAEEGKIEKQLNDGLAIQNKIVSIVGPSKCGKTTLCEKIFGTEKGRDRLMITGDACDSTGVFWGDLFSQTSSGAAHEGDEYPTRAEIIELISKADLPVIIDDFHYIDQAIQKQLCQQMKNAAAKGVRFIVLNTPQRGDDPIRNNQDLAGRFFSVNVNFWEKGGLREIGSKGFQILGIKVDGEILDRLAKECLGSPQLMQTLCLELGREYLNLDIPFERQEITVSKFDWPQIRQRAVRSYDHTTLFDKLKNGPPRRGQARSVYKIINGEDGDVYDVIAYALASDPPFLSINIDQIKDRAKNILKKADQPNFNAALDQINGLFETGHKPVEYDEEKNTVNILDPHFYFYLRTKAAETLA